MRVYVEQHIRSAEERALKRNKISICIDCEKSAGGCQWSAHLIPIEGWKASDSEKYPGGYHIKRCPDFEERGEAK